MRSIEELRERIAGDAGLAAVLAEAESRIVNDSDPGHDVGHLLRVALWTLKLAGNAVDWRSALAAALLHDTVNPPKDSAASAGASERSADLARRMLPSHGFPPAAVEEIAAAIRDHSYSRGAVPASALGRALQDADRLDALGAIGIFRALACGVRMGSDLFDLADPWAARRSLDDRRFTLDHFFTKLLGLAGTLHTEPGRREAARRVERMRAFLDGLGEEIGARSPRAPGSQ